MTTTKSLELAEVKATYKSKIKPSTMPKITDAGESYRILNGIWDQDKIEHVEEFVILLLNRANRLMGWVKISSGGAAGTVADPKIIFQHALITNASAIILAHNHPSGNLNPSAADRELTSKIVAAGKVLQIEVLDHIIITSEGFKSLQEEGIM